MPSQFGQDLFVLEVLDGMCGGFFLDSGASDGIRVSNTHLLETECGWTGICVEPNQAFFAQLVANRRCRCVNCCLYDRDATVDFVEAAHVLGGILEAYQPGHLALARARFRIPDDSTGRPATVAKPACTVRSVLRDCGAPAVIDYWSLDTEGSELAILQSFPFDEYSFRVLTVEHNRMPVRDEIRAFLEGVGYRRVRELEIDDGYVLRASPRRPPWRSGVWRRNR